MDDDNRPALTELAAYLSVGGDLESDALLRLMMEVGVGLVKADEGSLLLVERDRRELVFRATVGSEASEEALRGQRVPLDEGLIGLVAATGEPQAGAPRYHGVEMADQEPKAELAAPIAVGEEVIGVLTAVKFGERATFEATDLGLFTQFGRMCGLLIRQRFREERVRAILTGGEGGEGDQADPLLRSLLEGPLGEGHRLMADIADNLAEIAGGRADVLQLCAELTSTLARITRAVGWPADDEARS